jgi:hypothetical protein
MPDDLKDAIEKNAQGQKRAKGNVGEVEQHSLTEQIEADRYLASREAQGKPRKAVLRTNTARPEWQTSGVRLEG